MTIRQMVVRVGQIAVGGAADVLVTLGLGSCVAVVIHDADARVGGMAHILLPEPGRDREAPNPARFATTAIPLLVGEIGKIGGEATRMRARLVGGASMFSSLMVSGSRSMGERNVDAAREALGSLGVPILAEEVGGDHGRSVRFRAGEGRLVISSVHRDDVVL